MQLYIIAIPPYNQYSFAIHVTSSVFLMLHVLTRTRNANSKIAKWIKAHAIFQILSLCLFSTILFCCHQINRLTEHDVRHWSSSDPCWTDDNVGNASLATWYTYLHVHTCDAWNIFYDTHYTCINIKGVKKVYSHSQPPPIATEMAQRLSWERCQQDHNLNQGVKDHARCHITSTHDIMEKLIHLRI